MNEFRTPGNTAGATLSTLALALTLTLTVSARPAFAEGDKREQAKAHFRAGQQAFDSNQYLVAARAFEESYKALPVPEIAFSMAQAYRLQYYVDGNYLWLRRAKKRYEEYKTKKPKGNRLGDCLTHIGEITTILAGAQISENMAPAETPKITQVMIISQARGAKGTFQGKTDELPLILDLDPGQYEVAVEADGYYPQKKTFTAVKDQFITVEVAMQPRKALVQVATKAGAEVAIDGRPEGRVPLLRPLEVEEGEHFIAVTRRGHRPWAEQIVLTRGQEVTLEPKLRITTQRKVSYGFAAVGVLSAVATTVAAVRTAATSAEAEAILDDQTFEFITPTQLAEYNTLRRERSELYTTTVGLALVTGAALITGGLLYYLDTPRVERPSANAAPAGPDEPATEDSPSILSVTPAVGPGMAGLSVNGRF